MKHTPGPWENNGYIAGMTAIMVYNKKIDRDIATIYRKSCTKEEQEANARLIASAPELLSAGKEALEYLRIQCNIEGGDIYDNLKTAIAKAEGADK